MSNTKTDPKIIATGRDAIKMVERYEWITLCKYADPTEPARVGLTMGAALELVREDPALVYAVDGSAVVPA